MDTTKRATCWSLTINNPTADDDDCIAKATAKRWVVEGQKEVGAEGTPHYQLMLKTPQVRFSAVKALFPRAHIEVAKSPSALAKYVHKEDTRSAPIPKGSDMYPSLEKTYCMFVDYICEKRIREMNYSMPECSVTVMMDPVINGWDNDEVVKQFDNWCCRAIEDGYFVEQWAVNPQVRSALMKFGKSILVRHAAINDRKKSEYKSITNGVDEKEEVSTEVELDSSETSGTPSA